MQTLRKILINLIAILALIGSPVWAAQRAVFLGQNTTASGGGGGTWTLVQFKYFDSLGAGTGGSVCPGATLVCTVTITAPAAGDLLIATGLNGSNTTGQSMSIAPTEVPPSGETWTHCGGTNGCVFGNTATGFADAWYVLSAVAGGQTTITCHYAQTQDTYGSCGLYEYHWSGSSITFDTSNGAIDATCTSCAGAVLTLGGTTDVIVQIALTIPGSGVTAINGSFTNPKQFYSGSGNAGWINATTGTTPNWSQGSSTLTVMGIAFKGN